MKQGDTVELNGSSSKDNIGITNWTWSFDDGSETVSLEGMVVEHTFKKTGTFTITLSVNDGSGNIKTDSCSVTVERNDYEKKPFKGYLTVFFILIAVIVAIIVYLLLLNKKKKKKLEIGTVDAGQIFHKSAG
ncbi:MAG: PKD domain-containing protein [Candidatus Moduliflexus flocculans]|nr:PKD domain-containing protein [Candidatus Moduliflexus flocculans]